MRKTVRLFPKISLVVFALATLVLLAIPSSQAQPPIVPAPNDRCTMPQDVAVPAGFKGSTSRECFFFDTTANTAGPIGIDVVFSTVTSTNDNWFRWTPPCAPLKVQFNTLGSTYPHNTAVITEGGGLPFFVCDGVGFFDSDVVILPGPFATVIITPDVAARDWYILADDASSGIGGVQRICIQMACL